MGIVKNIAAYFAAGVFLFCCSGARARAENEPFASEEKPRIVLKTDDSFIEYTTASPPLSCGADAAGCTVKRFSGGWTVHYLPSGRVEKIELFLTLKNTVIISTEYPKGTCLFDKVLKHELTHVALGRGVLKKYAPETAKAVLAKLDSLPQPIDEAGYAELETEVNRMISAMTAENNRQDALIDGGDNYKYQWKQALKICSTEEREKNPFTPEVILKADKGRAVRILSDDTETGSFSSQFYFSWDFERTPSGNVKKGYLTVGFRDIKMMLPSRYPENSCRYNYALRYSLSMLWLQRYLLAVHADEIKGLFASRLARLSLDAPASEYDRLRADILKIKETKIESGYRRADITGILNRDLQDSFQNCLKNGSSERVSKENIISRRAMENVINTLKKPYNPKRGK